MRTFTEKSTTQPTASTKSSTHGRTRVGRSHYPNSILSLERTIGNQAASGLLQANTASPEGQLTTTISAHYGHVFRRIPVTPPRAGSKPGDEFEQEADRVSEQVMRMPGPQMLGACPCDGGCPQCQGGEPVPQRTATPVDRTNGPKVLRQPEAKVEAVGSGQPLTNEDRAFFEARFGAEFSSVRVHADSSADAAARAVGAHAYTRGSDIVFRSGQYRPSTHAGRQLLAHELAHVLQQGGVPSSGLQRRGAVGGQDSDTAVALPSRGDAERVAREFRRIALDANTMAEFQRTVEEKAGEDLGFLGADCVVFSLSTAFGCGFAAGLGFEALYSPRFGWATYFQAGLGLSTCGAGVALEVGLIWDLGDPGDYAGSFIEVAVTGGPGDIGYWPGMGSASGTVTPGDIANLATEGTLREPRGIKVGGGYGTPGAQVTALWEWYWLLSGSPTAEQTEGQVATPTEVEPQPATPEQPPVPERQVDTTVEVFVDTLSAADREGYSRVRFTLDRVAGEIIPGFSKSGVGPPRTPAGAQAESGIRTLVEIVARMQPVGRYIILAERDSVGWQLSFRSATPRETE
jgi:hypothetical protein